MHFCHSRMPSPGPLLHQAVVIAMKSTSEIAHLNALAFLYDHLMDFPVWFRKLTRGQLENIATIIVALPPAHDGSAEIVPMEEIEKREVYRAIRLCN